MMVLGRTLLAQRLREHSTTGVWSFISQEEELSLGSQETCFSLLPQGGTMLACWQGGHGALVHDLGHSDIVRSVKRTLATCLEQLDSRVLIGTLSRLAGTASRYYVITKGAAYRVISSRRGALEERGRKRDEEETSEEGTDCRTTLIILAILMKGFTTKRTSAMPILPLLCVTRSTSAFTWFPLQDESPTPPDLPDIVVPIEEDAPRPTAEPAEIEVDSVEEGVSFRCPLPTAIGCTAPDPLASDECSEVGTLCPTRIEFGEHCCLDECGRTFCTAKPAKRAAITAVDDYTFTRDGASVRFNVLFNDFTIDYSTNLNFGVELTLTQVMPGFNGFCDVESPGVLSYTPDPVFDGSDYCVYTVCETTDLTNCDTATLEIAVTTTDAITLDFLSPDRPLIEVDNAAILSDRHPVSDIYPEGTSPYETVGGAESFMTDELWTELLDEIGLSSKNGEANYGLHVQAPSCEDGEELLSIELQGDEFGDDITWELRREYNTGQNATVEVSKGPYGKHPYEYLDLCVPNPSMYTFTIRDVYGDGLCDTSQCGYYKIFLGGRELVHVDQYGYNNTHLINVGFDPSPGMSDRDMRYLHAHNKRRSYWHRFHDRPFQALAWSPSLAADSARWATELLGACDNDGIEHEPNVEHGENLAKNLGLVEDFGQLYDPDLIVGRWIDRELGWPWPANAHLTQALWRASKYMGCGEAEKDWQGGKCRVQVCRYAKAGNCNMGSFNATDGVNWLEPMLSDTSPCEPSCPFEGCY
ncbi:hypothetical protein THAOC_09884 [Thalassiosira oceanica]|uniref:SCP domain-containing protein n=1 Tax=Thalassiosira oceanica TaxID=159749 RepID=K0SRI5_THAOC|nr:hypothetical protein THAOC_09884 [Thalassiosira oceanica]|eukprot:EJK68903.1 hypothetical protein THAOC_09884 [Thalassiosira oceanica]